MMTDDDADDDDNDDLEEKPVEHLLHRFFITAKSPCASVNISKR